MKIVIERAYPYICGAAACILLELFKIDLSGSEGLDNALNGIITMTSLIICFLGAILPLIATARIDSSVVENVFRYDTHGLFFKYMKESVTVGLVLVIACIVTYFRNDLPSIVIQKSFMYIDSFLLVAFLLCTFRSYSFIFEIMKLVDSDIKRNSS